MRQIVAAGLAAALLTLAGCQSSVGPYRSSFYVYEGESASVGLADVSIVMEDGRVIPFAEVYKGYRPFTGLATPFMPIHEMYLSDRDIHDPDFIALLARYDANKNGLAEVPELIVLYAVEGARGLDFPASHLSVDGSRIDALNTSAAGLHGMRLYIEQNAARMTAEVRRHIRMLNSMYQKLLIRNNDLGNDDGPRDH